MRAVLLTAASAALFVVAGCGDESKVFDGSNYSDVVSWIQGYKTTSSGLILPGNCEA